MRFVWRGLLLGEESGFLLLLLDFVAYGVGRCEFIWIGDFGGFLFSCSVLFLFLFLFFGVFFGVFYLLCS